MKIVINYDLLEKISEAKTGLSLIKTSKKVLLKATRTEIFYIILSLIYSLPITIKNSIQAYCFYLALHLISETVDINKNKIKALEEIKRLALKLSDLNICTEHELLMGSYVYEKEYELVNEENSILPKICQKKYIMVPVYDNGKTVETSLLQEHIIGSKSYILSHGEPSKQRVFRPAFGSI